MQNEQLFTISDQQPIPRKGYGLPQQKTIEIFPKDYGFIDQPDKQWFLCYSGRKPSKAKIEDYVEDECLWVRQSLTMIGQDTIPRFFIALKQMGVLDSDNKVGFAVGYKGRLVSKVDAPLTSVVFTLLMEVSNIVSYSNTDAAQRDLSEFKKLVNELEIT